MKNAFTLSEILVTLGIIGVVSALTIPSLVKSNQKKAFAVQIQKTYSELSQAVENAMTDTQSATLAGTKMFKSHDSTFFNKYLKASNVCWGCDYSNYFNYEYYTVHGHSATHGAHLEISTSTCAILKDGASVCIRPWHNYAYVLVDTNGKAKPNVVGRDLFKMKIDENGEVTYSCHGYSTSSPECMFGYLMNNNWEMTY